MQANYCPMWHQFETKGGGERGTHTIHFGAIETKEAAGVVGGGSVCQLSTAQFGTTLRLKGGGGRGEAY